VLKKRLLDTSAGVSEIDFEELLAHAIEIGIAAIEGDAPQRIIYPSAGHVMDGAAPVRKFECAGQMEGQVTNLFGGLDSSHWSSPFCNCVLSGAQISINQPNDSRWSRRWSW
jgi:hypothetical protein